MSTVKENRYANLLLLIEEAGSVPRLEEKTGVTANYLRQIKNKNAIQNGKPKGIGDKIAAKLEDGMNKPRGWLDQIHSQSSANTPPSIETNVGERGGFELWNSQTPLSDDDYEVPFLKDIELAAGDGAFDQIEDYNGFKLRFSKATLRRQNVQYENAVCVTASGSSMEPVIPDGTTIGVDLGNKTIKDGKIYAINHGGLLRVKILIRLPNEQVIIRSYNSEEYPDEIAHLSEFNVIGKVFWWSVLV